MFLSQSALGDDELVLGHRHSEWTGFAPQIEEDVAFSSIAQDEIGHAAAFYAIAGAITGDHPDKIALGREPGDYRNAVICERPNRDWSYTLARHWLYDTADDVRLEALENTSHNELRLLVTKLRREERYHLIHADAWMIRIAKGPVEARSRLIDALTEAFREADGLFEPIEAEEEALSEGLLVTPSSELQKAWHDRAAARLDELGLPTDISARGTSPPSSLLRLRVISSKARTAAGRRRVLQRAPAVAGASTPKNSTSSGTS